MLVVDNSAAGRLLFTTDLPNAVRDAEIVFIAVGTPARGNDGHADLSYVYAAAASVARAITGFTVIVTKSTVPVGTGDEIERIVREINPAADFVVASNPEFLREGAAIHDFKLPDRIVIGIEDEHRRQRAGCGARHRHGQSHRLEIPQCRPGFRWLLLPQGHHGPRQDRPGL